MGGRTERTGDGASDVGERESVESLGRELVVLVSRSVRDPGEHVGESPGVTLVRYMREVGRKGTYLFVSPRPRDPRPQLACTVERVE